LHYKKEIEKHKMIRDKYDAHVIACGQKMDCDLIVSGDKDLLSYKRTKMRIINSNDYLKLLKAGELGGNK